MIIDTIQDLLLLAEGKAVRCSDCGKIASGFVGLPGGDHQCLNCADKEFKQRRNRRLLQVAQSKGGKLNG